MSVSEAKSLWLFDRDPGSEACAICAKTLLLVEGVQGLDAPKSARVTKRLGKDAGCKAMLLRYTTTRERLIPGTDLPDIEIFKAFRLWQEPEREKTFTPEAWAQYLVQIRRDHYPHCEGR